MKIKHFLLIAFITVLSACETNENPDVNITADDIVGSWNVTDFTIEVSTSVTAQNVTATSKTSGYGKDFDFIYTFSENPNVASGQGSYTSVTTTEIPGQQDIVQELVVNSIDGLDEGSWSLEGSSITIIDPNNQSSTADIISFSGDKLILKQSVDQDQNINGSTITITGEAFITLEK
jgi:hypothetical protein